MMMMVLYKLRLESDAGVSEARNALVDCFETENLTGQTERENCKWHPKPKQVYIRSDIERDIQHYGIYMYVVAALEIMSDLLWVLQLKFLICCQRYGFGGNGNGWGIIFYHVIDMFTLPSIYQIESLIQDKVALLHLPH